MSQEQVAVIEKVIAIGSEVWRALASWGKKTRIMSIMEKKRIEHLASAIDREMEIAYPIAESCLKILELAKENGFVE